MEFAAIDEGELAQARRRRIVGFESHGLLSPHRPVVTSMRWPSARVTIAFFMSCCRPRTPRKALVLPLRKRVLTEVTLTSNSFSIASLICGLVALRAHLEDELVAFGRHRRLLGDHRRDDRVVVASVPVHLNRASSASTAALVSTSFSRRMMSYTLTPWTGSTSIWGRLRAARVEVLVHLRAVDDEGVAQRRPGEGIAQRLRLALGELRLLPHHEAARADLGGERVAQRERAHLLGQVMRVAARDRTHRPAAAAELRHAGRAVTGAAGALLLVHLLAGAIDLAASECLVVSGLALGQLPAHHARDDVGARLEAEDRVVEFERARRPIRPSTSCRTSWPHSPLGASAGAASPAASP